MDSLGVVFVLCRAVGNTYIRSDRAEINVEGPTNAHVGRDSAVGTGTRYGLDGPGMESRWGRDFSQPSRPALGPTQPPI